MKDTVREEARLAGKHIIDDCWCEHPSAAHAWFTAGHDGKCPDDCTWNHVHVHCTPCADEHHDWRCCEPKG